MIYKDRNAGVYYVAGKEHSWGSFKSRGDAQEYIDKVAKEDREYAERQKVISQEIRERHAREDEEWKAAQKARLEADEALYGSKLPY